MRTLSRYCLIVFTIFTAISGFSQSQVFKAVLVDEDGSIIKGGIIVFPLKRDSAFFGATDTAYIDLSSPQNRVFYFYRGDDRSKIFRIDPDSADKQLHQISFVAIEYYLDYRKKHICPICLKSNSLIPIVYGFPSGELVRQAKHNIIRLGGCPVYDEMPLLYCRKDDLEF